MSANNDSKERIVGWVLLIGFVLLLINITFIGMYLQQSLIIYVCIMVYFLSTNGKRIKKQAENTEENSIENTEEKMENDNNVTNTNTMGEKENEV